MKKKAVIYLMTFITVYLFTFFVPRLMPGDALAYLSESAITNMEVTSLTPEDAMRAYYGLDLPIGEQFVRTLQRNLHGDLGESIYYKQPVWHVVLTRMPWSLYIMSVTLGISLLLGVLLAFISVRRKRTDAFLYGLMTVQAETPPFLLGVLLLFLVAAKVDWIPLSGAQSSFAFYQSSADRVRDLLVHSLMPICAMVLSAVPGFYMTARTSFLGILGRNYMITAQAKGLPRGRVNRKYILKNAMAPIVARFFLSVGYCLSATLLIENVFAYPGLGKLMRDAVLFRDYPLIQGVFLISTTFVLLCSFLSDLINERRLKGEEK